MKFPARFISWIKACVTSAMLSVKVNGSLEGYFNAKSGLRQGDPISPYLFVIAMEVFSACIAKCTTGNNFKYHWGTKQVGLTHLTFADDIMMFCYGNDDSIQALMDGIRLFSNISGLIPNRDKSFAFFCNVPTAVEDLALNISGFQRGYLPITYLGLPLISTKLKARDCQPLVLRLCRRIEIWTCRFLSFAGRLQLIKAILFSIQGYWAAYLFLPKGVIKRIQSVLANFLWGGTSTSSKHHKVSWSDCCLPKNEGGLGIKSLEKM